MVSSNTSGLDSPPPPLPSGETTADERKRMRFACEFGMPASEVRRLLDQIDALTAERDTLAMTLSAAQDALAETIQDAVANAAERDTLAGQVAWFLAAEDALGQIGTVELSGLPSAVVRVVMEQHDRAKAARDQAFDALRAALAGADGQEAE